MKRNIDLPYDYHMKHIRDNYKNLGYSYKGHIFENSVSKQVMSQPDNASMIKKIERMIFFLVEQVKTLKTQFNFAVDKDSKLLN